MQYPTRKTNRLQGYDYSQNNVYFITICAKNRQQLFGSVIVGGGALDAAKTPNSRPEHPLNTETLQTAEITLSPIGMIADKYINIIPQTYPHISIDTYVVMPNHIHMIINVCNIEKGTAASQQPANAIIPSLVSTLKRFINKECRFSVFQRSYHDRIIRNQQEYEKIWQYINTNLLLWEKDCFYNQQTLKPEWF